MQGLSSCTTRQQFARSSMLANADARNTSNIDCRVLESLLHAPLAKDAQIATSQTLTGRWPRRSTQVENQSSHASDRRAVQTQLDISFVPPCACAFLCGATIGMLFGEVLLPGRAMPVLESREGMWGLLELCLKSRGIQASRHLTPITHHGHL